MKYTGPVRFILKGDFNLAQRYTSRSRLLLQQAMDRMGPDKAYWIKTLPDGTQITVSSLGGVKQVWITVGPTEEKEECNLHGFFIEQDGDLNYLIVPADYLITRDETETIIQDLEAGNHAWFDNTDKIVSWKTNDDARHIGAGIGDIVYINGCPYAKAPGNISGAAILHDQIVVANSSTVWWKPFLNRPYDTDSVGEWKSVSFSTELDLITDGCLDFKKDGSEFSLNEGKATLSWDYLNQEFTAGTLESYPLDAGENDSTDYNNSTSITPTTYGEPSSPYIISDTTTTKLAYLVGTPNPDFDGGEPCGPDNKQFISIEVKTYEGVPHWVGGYPDLREKEPSQSYLGGAYTSSGSLTTAIFINFSTGDRFTGVISNIKDSITDIEDITKFSGYHRIDMVGFSPDGVERNVGVKYGSNPYYMSGTYAVGYEHQFGVASNTIDIYTHTEGDYVGTAEARKASIEASGCSASDTYTNTTVASTHNSPGTGFRQYDREHEAGNINKYDLVVYAGRAKAPLKQYYSKSGSQRLTPIHYYGEIAEPFGIFAYVHEFGNFVASANLAAEIEYGPPEFNLYNDIIIPQTYSIVLDVSARDEVLFLVTQTAKGEGMEYKVWYKFPDGDYIVASGLADSGRTLDGYLFSESNLALAAPPIREFMYYDEGASASIYSDNFSLDKSRIVSRNDETLLYSKITLYDEEIETIFAVKGSNADDTIQIRTIDPVDISIEELKAL